MPPGSRPQQILPMRKFGTGFNQLRSAGNICLRQAAPAVIDAKIRLLPSGFLLDDYSYRAYSGILKSNKN